MHSNLAHAQDAVYWLLGRPEPLAPLSGVVDADLVLTGVVTLADLGRIAKDSRELAPLLLAMDLAIPSETVHLGDNLRVALQRMGIRGSSSLPVVDKETGRLVGVVTRAGILAAYERMVASG